MSMMLDTFACSPPSCAAMLPQKFSPATTWITPFWTELGVAVGTAEVDVKPAVGDGVAFCEQAAVATMARKRRPKEEITAIRRRDFVLSI